METLNQSGFLTVTIERVMNSLLKEGISVKLYRIKVVSRNFVLMCNLHIRIFLLENIGLNSDMEGGI